VPQRIAAILALIAFTLCLLVGSLHAGNSFGTTVIRALAAMSVTFVIGLALGAMAQRMIEDNVRTHEQKLRNQETKVETSDR